MALITIHRTDEGLNCAHHVKRNQVVTWQSKECDWKIEFSDSPFEQSTFSGTKGEKVSAGRVKPDCRLEQPYFYKLTPVGALKMAGTDPIIIVDRGK